MVVRPDREADHEYRAHHDRRRRRLGRLGLERTVGHLVNVLSLRGAGAAVAPARFDEPADFPYFLAFCELVMPMTAIIPGSWVHGRCREFADRWVAWE